MLGTKDAQPMDLAVQQDHHRNVPTHTVECKFFGATSCFQVLDTERSSEAINSLSVRVFLLVRAWPCVPLVQEVHGEV